jgi:hypothetical protein
MKRSYWLGLAALALVVGSARPIAAGPAEDAASPLAQVPAKAPIVIHIRGVEQTKDRLIAMIKEALPDLGGKAEEKINSHIKELLEGRSLKGMAKNGPAFFVFNELPKNNEDEQEYKKKVAFLVRVTKYAEFRDGLLTEDERKELKKENGYEKTKFNGDDVYFVNRGEWTVVAPSKESAKALANKPPQGLDGKLAKDLAAKLLDSDAAVYVDMAAVRAQFGDQIADAKKDLEDHIGGADNIPGLQKSQSELVKKLIPPLFQAFEDSQAVVFACDFRKPGLAIHAQGSVGAGTKTNQMLKGMKPSAFDELGRMPAGMMSYSAIQLHDGWAKDLSGYLFGAQGGDDEKENKKLKAAIDELISAKPRSRLDATSLPLKTFQVWTFDDPAKAVAAQLKVVRALEVGDTFQVAPIKDPKVKENAEKHGNFTFHSYSATWDFEKMVENMGDAGGLPGMKEAMPNFMKKLVGSDLHVWFGTDGKSVIQASGKDFKDVQAQLDRFTKGQKTIGEETAYKEARKHMPKEATFLTLVDFPAYLRGMMDGFQALAPIPLPLGAAGKSKTTFLGMAVTAKPERGSFDLWIPGATAQEIYKMVEPLIKQFGLPFGTDALQAK